jgi:hypothetical protein
VVGGVGGAQDALGAQRPGDLDREVPGAARRAVDQDHVALAGAGGAQRLQGGQGGRGTAAARRSSGRPACAPRPARRRRPLGVGALGAGVHLVAEPRRPVTSGRGPTTTPASSRPGTGEAAIQVGRVHAGGADLDQESFRGRARVGQLL